MHYEYFKRKWSQIRVQDFFNIYSIENFKQTETEN